MCEPEALAGRYLISSLALLAACPGRWALRYVSPPTPEAATYKPRQKIKGLSDDIRRRFTKAR